MSLNWIKDYERNLLAGEIEQAAEIKNNYTNRSFYKYRCFDGNGYWKDWIKGTLYANSPEYFNDPFDSFLTVAPETNIIMQRNALKDILSQYCKLSKLDISRLDYSDNPINASFVILRQKCINLDERLSGAIKENMENYIQTASQLLRKTLKVTCFSEKRDSILMWSHYTINHQGFCIEYNFNNILDVSKRVYPVIYSKERPILLPEHMKGSSKFVSVLLFKAREWEYEKEWRYIVAKTTMIGKKWNQPIVLSAPNAIKAVYLGIEAIKHHGDLVKELSDMARGMSIPLYAMRFHDSEYVLSSHKIDYI